MKIHVIDTYMQDNKAFIVFSTLKTLRHNFNIPSECKFNSSVKSQLNYAKRCKATELIWLQDDKFYFQDLHEYPEWMGDEFGTINFEKREYNSLKQLITEELAGEV